MVKENPLNCPYCGGENGFHTKEIVDFKNIFYWDGSHAEGVHTNSIRGGKAFYCCDCGRNITSHIKKPEGY
ncbi:molecular chaperone DnaJ [Enterobacter cloacae]|jgi:DNA-directed RNA polymerase subunit RPC12/RpoP|uniref:molecular chaperone DnaJ n=1 Tax=Enterobacter cloacae TaxID=550 RepID=UPI0009419C9C|nr:molecular chaperone DnaJ [Enterobacter cloacae]EAY4270131.1 molecular chaperone DnaJ [Salmonella enterica]